MVCFALLFFIICIIVISVCFHVVFLSAIVDGQNISRFFRVNICFNFIATYFLFPSPTPKYNVGINCRGVLMDKMIARFLGGFR